MRFFYIVCKSFKFKDDFMAALMSPYMKPGGIYRCFQDDVGINYLFVNDRGTDRCVLLGNDLSSNADPRYTFSFYELNLSNFYLGKRIPFLVDEYELMNKWTDERKNPFKPNPIEAVRETYEEEMYNDEDNAPNDIYIQDVDFILQNYDDLYDISSHLQEGFLRSIDSISQIKGNIEPPGSEETAEKMLFTYIEEFNQTKDSHSLGLAQLMLYYIFGYKK